MAVRFPTNQNVQRGEISLDDCCDHIIAVAIKGDWDPRHVAVDSDTNRIYVADDGHIFIFTENGQYLNTFQHGDMSSPWGIAIHEGNVYITDNSRHFVFKFSLEGRIRLVAKIGYRGIGAEQFQNPQGLAISKIGHIFVVDSNNDRLKILDSDLKFQHHISHHSMSKPVDLKLKANQLYVLSVHYLSPTLIHVFSHDGDKLSEIILRKHVSVQICAKSFCFDPNGNFLVSDSWSNQIKIFTEEGILIDTLGSYGKTLGKFSSLRGIALTNNLKLVVLSLHGDCRLQIFSCF